VIEVPRQILQRLHRHVHQEVQAVPQAVLAADQVDQDHPVAVAIVVQVDQAADLCHIQDPLRQKGAGIHA